MRYDEVVNKIIQEENVELSTMMKTPCLRYNNNFIAMMFEKEDALIIKVSPARVDELIADGTGMEFNFPKKGLRALIERFP